MRSQDWDAKFAAKEPLFTDRPNVTVAEEVAGLRPGRALDLGAGQGRNAVWLAEHGWQVTAVDFSPVGLSGAEQLARARGVSVTFELADVLRWQAPRGAFDLVLLSFLQLPADELRPVLAGASAAVAPGGRLLVVAHDRDNLVRGYGGPKDPEVLYTVDKVVAALDGLDVTRAEQLERQVDTEIGPFTMIDTVVAANKARA